MSSTVQAIATVRRRPARCTRAFSSKVAHGVNIGLTLLHWRVGKRIRTEVLQGERAAYGEQVVPALAARLTVVYGNGFGERNLRRMLQFAEAFPDERIVASLIRQLTWTHILALLPLKDPLQRDFYAEMCRIERWSVRALREKIDSMLYERTALSRKPEALIREELAALREEDRLTPDLVFRDPYVLDFLGLKDTYSERDLEDALLREIERFLLELGAGFAFVERQKRITLDGDDYQIDLLFNHRRLRRLVAIELKIGDFKPADAGQVELYLRWLDRHERQEGEAKPIGLIFAPARSARRSSCCSSRLEGFGSPSIWPNSRRRSCWPKSFTRPSSRREPAWSCARSGRSHEPGTACQGAESLDGAFAEN